MALGKRRPGFSRRAQYGRFIGLVAAVAGAMFAALLLFVVIVNPGAFSTVRGGALDATGPVSSGGRSIGWFFNAIGDTVSNYFRAGSQNDRLRRELAEARRELIARQALDYENRRLSALLGLARRSDDQVTLARIVGSSFDAPQRLATLSAGTSAGVAPGQPVRAPDGLIGRVLETGRWASRVLLISDGSSNVPVRLVRDGTPAIAVGRGDGTIELRTLEVGQNPFRRGDILVTSGIGGIFPPNIPVAMVTTLQGDTAIARPLADPARMDYAIVLRVYQPAATGSLGDARQQAPAPPVAPPAPAPRPGQQNNPLYQPALQQQRPDLVVQQPAAGTPPR
jgi:rod shape-determining protein MreC